jgi:hypothetical protein
MSEYEKHKVSWESFWRDYASRPSRRASTGAHSVTAAQFSAELQFLYRITKDSRFREALLALDQRGLVDPDGRWRRGSAPEGGGRLYSRETEQGLARTIDLFRKRKGSLRAACAYLADDLSVEAASFEAAVRYLERLWRRHYGQSQPLAPD